MATPTAGSYRAHTGTQAPQLFTNSAGTYQYGIMPKANYHGVLFKRSLATGAITDSYATSTISALTTEPAAGQGAIAPLDSTEDANASHYGWALAVQTVGGQDFLHLVGNSLATTPHYATSGACTGSTLSTSWTAHPWPFPGYPTTGGHSTTGGPYCTYNTLDRLPDDTLIWNLDQRDPAVGPSVAEGKDNLAFYLPAGASNWVPVIAAADGEFANSGTGTPNRLYLSGCYVHPRPDLPNGYRYHCWGNWRDDWTDPASTHRLWHLMSDDITSPTSWKRADGSSQTMPMNDTNSGYTTNTGACIPLTHGTYSSFSSGQICCNKAGNPRVILREDGGNTWWLTAWNGSAWVQTAIGTTALAPGPFHVNGQDHEIHGFSSRARILRATPSGVLNVDAGPVDMTSHAWVAYVPSWDPELMRRGVASFLIGDGDTPNVVDFGKKVRMHP